MEHAFLVSRLLTTPQSHAGRYCPNALLHYKVQLFFSSWLTLWDFKNLKAFGPDNCYHYYGYGEWSASFRGNSVKGYLHIQFTKILVEFHSFRSSFVWACYQASIWSQHSNLSRWNKDNFCTARGQRRRHFVWRANHRIFGHYWIPWWKKWAEVQIYASLVAMW